MGHDDERDLVPGRPVERLIFGTPDEGEVGAVVQRFCGAALGSDVRETRFVRTSVGVVFGLELEDGRRVVLKAHQPRQSIDFLRAVFETQSYLAEHGFPCPRPVAGPGPLANGFASVEEWVEDGFFADAHNPVIRQTMAQALARLVKLTRPLGQPTGLRRAWSLWEGDGVWPATAHSPIFDFAATAEGAEWIDELAGEAKAAIPGGTEELVIHSDWSSKHFRFGDSGEITVIYDWDSLALRTEVQAVGTAAATFTANFELDVRYAPTPDEVNAFIADYSDARPTRLSPEQVLAARVVAAHVVAYTARCEHALGKRGDFHQSLAQFGRAYLPPANQAAQATRR